MGNCFSGTLRGPNVQAPQNTFRAPRNCTTNVRHIVRPSWRATGSMTAAELKQKREVFWDTQPHYGGSREIWDALRGACESDLSTACVILESAGVIVASEDMSVCYDELGRRYDVPIYVWCDPVNLVQDAMPRIPE